MDGGEIVAEGTPENLKREISGDVVTLGVSDGIVDKAREVLDRESYTRRSETVEAGVRLYVEAGNTSIPHMLRTLDAAGIEPTSIELHRPSLDDVFLAKTGRSLRES
jgi:ABC-2 type transport system ATP-binding protein